MCLSEFSKEDIVLLASTISIAISNEFSNNDDLVVLATFFTVLGDNLALLSL